jgi:hypothetical protein
MEREKLNNEHRTMNTENEQENERRGEEENEFWMKKGIKKRKRIERRYCTEDEVKENLEAE